MKEDDEEEDEEEEEKGDHQAVPLEAGKRKKSKGRWRRGRQEANKLPGSKPATSATQRPFVSHPLSADCSPRRG